MFKNDYSEICAKEVFDAIASHMGEQNSGYGTDGYSKQAAGLILKSFGLSEADARVHFLAGGTQTNTTVISYFLRPYEAVIACDTGHINVHETGAVEGSGHKVLTAPNVDGKLTAEDVAAIVRRHTDEHMVKPRMVYISDSTETGTVYTAEELRSLRKVCNQYGLILFLDGARLGIALTSGSDVSAELIGEVCDVFYVGGTKNGAMFGEAVVMKNAVDTGDFRFHIKNRTAMVAKGFLLGIQFAALFTDNLYFRLAQNSNDTARFIRDELAACGIAFAGKSTTNQIFIRVDRKLAAAVMEKFGAELWEDGDDKQTVRIVTSFATKMESCRELTDFIKANK